MKILRPKCVVACEDVKLELLGQYFTRMITSVASSGSWQGRSLKIFSLMSWLLTMSQNAAVSRKARDHHHPFTPKFIVANRIRNK